MPIQNVNRIKEIAAFSPSSARRDQEEALDEALKNTFPASDPGSIEQPVPPASDLDGLWERAKQRARQGADVMRPRAVTTTH